jgi:hypothetical protein
MELRQTEEKVNELIAIYERVRNARLSDSNQAAKNNLLPEIEAGVEGASDELAIPEVLALLKTIDTSIEDLKPKMDRFRKRLGEKDAVTGNPRYGEKTATQVSALLGRNDQLVQAMDLLNDASVVQDMEQTVGQIEAAKLREIEEERRREEEAEKTLQNQEEEEKRRLQQHQAEEEAARQRELLELNRRAEESRQARQAAEEARLQQERHTREERQSIDREWMATVTKGTDGVRHELARLREATKDDPEAQTTALGALHTLFSQISSHPEETKFRRIRRDHAKFQQDIGRHQGGREVLIAAGFRCGAIDDVPCYLSTEPSIENDMDGWSDWFNLLKATLEIVEEELIK